MPTGRLYNGLGKACAVMVGLLVRRPRWPVVHGEAADTPNLLDLINEGDLMTNIDPQRILDLELDPNDAEATTVRGYLIALLFGNSSWEYELYVPLVKAGVVPGSLDEDGYIEDFDRAAADVTIRQAITALGAPA